MTYQRLTPETLPLYEEAWKNPIMRTSRGSGPNIKAMAKATGLSPVLLKRTQAQYHTAQPTAKLKGRIISSTVKQSNQNVFLEVLLEHEAALQRELRALQLKIFRALNTSGS